MLRILSLLAAITLAIINGVIVYKIASFAASKITSFFQKLLQESTVK